MGRLFNQSGQQVKFGDLGVPTNIQQEQPQPQEQPVDNKSMLANIFAGIADYAKQRGVKGVAKDAGNLAKTLAIDVGKSAATAPLLFTENQYRGTKAGLKGIYEGIKTGDIRKGIETSQLDYAKGPWATERMLGIGAGRPGASPTETLTPREIAIGSMKAAEFPLLMYGGAETVATKTPSFLKNVYQGAKTGAGYGMGYGAMQGVPDVVEQPNVEGLKQLGVKTLTGGIGGGILGGGVAGTSDVVRRVFKKSFNIPEEIPPKASRTPQVESLAIKGGKETAEEGIDELKKKFVDLLPGAKQLRAETDKLYKQARGKKAAKLEKIFSEYSGEEAQQKALQVLSGELPKATGLSIEKKLGQENINILKSLVTDSPVLSTWEKTPALSGLDKIIQGKAPQPSEISLLEEIFGKSFGQKMVELTKEDKILSLLNVPRSLKSTADISASMRQGLILGLRDPKQWAKNMYQQLRYFRSPQAYKKAQKEIISDVDYATARKFGIGLTDIKVSGGTKGKEEFFMGDLAEKIPIAGKIVSASDRGYTGFMNQQRMKTWKMMVQNLMKKGITPEKNPKEYQGVADLIRVASGRGDLKALGRSFEKVGNYAGVALFAPKYWASKIQMINPNWYLRLPSQARKEYFNMMGRYVAFVGGVLGTASMAGADVEMDPRSNNFGKFKPPGLNVWIDIMPVGRQEFLIASQFYTKKRKIATGDVKKLGDIFPGESRSSIIENYVQNKLAPIPGEMWRYLQAKEVDGETVDRWGQPITPGSTAENLVSPIYISEMRDAYKQSGADPAELSAIALAGLLGVGTSVPMKRYTASELKQMYLNEKDPKKKETLRKKFESAASKEKKSNKSEEEKKKDKDKAEKAAKTKLENLLKGVK